MLRASASLVIHEAAILGAATYAANNHVELETKEKVKEFHFKPDLRRKANAKEKRSRKIRWLRKLYRDAKNAELINEQGDAVN